MEVSKAISICIKNGIKVYPTLKDKYFVVTVDKNGSKKLSDKTHTNKTINKAIELTYIHIAKKIKKQIKFTKP